MLVVTGILNIVFAFLWRIHGTRPVDHWLVFGIHPLSPVEATVAGLALLGLARGLRRGLRPVWIATLTVILATTADRLIQGRPPEGSVLAIVFCVWLLLEHRHFRVVPTGVSRLFIWLAAAGLVLVAGAAGVGAIFASDHPTDVNVVFLVVVATVVLLLLVVRPNRGSRRTGAARREAFVRARGIIDAHGGDTLDYFALRDDKSWFFTGESVVADSVLNGVMLISPDPIGPPGYRPGLWSDVMDFAEGKRLAAGAVLAACRVPAARLPGGRPGRPLHRGRGRRGLLGVHPQGERP